MQKSFPASLENLHEMLQFVIDTSLNVGLETKFIPKLELAVEEALVNIISYSGLKSSDFIDITCTKCDRPGVKIVLKDAGIAHNPLKSVGKVDNNIPLEQRKIGGFGIYLILQFMDKVDYSFENNFNILSLVKYNA